MEVPLLDVGVPFPEGTVVVAVNLDVLSMKADAYESLIAHLDKTMGEPVAMRPDYANDRLEFAFSDAHIAFDFKLRWG